MTDSADNLWTVVINKRKKAVEPDEDYHHHPPQQQVLQRSPSPQFSGEPKITEPCWFYNNGGCKHKDGTEKAAHECKYLHTFSDNVKRPPHLSTKKPCDKFNLEGECRWHDSCKYSHRSLTPEEWGRFYPGVPFTIKNNVQKRIAIETKLQDIEGRMKIIEYKQDGMCRDIQYIGQLLQKYLRQQQAPASIMKPAQTPASAMPLGIGYPQFADYLKRN